MLALLRAVGLFALSGLMVEFVMIWKNRSNKFWKRDVFIMVGVEIDMAVTDCLKVLETYEKVFEIELRKQNGNVT